jgi:hypothetical protein
MNDNIDVTGIDPWELLAALHNASRVSPTTVCRVQAQDAITADQARTESHKNVRDEYQVQNGVPFWADYLFGRPIKAFLKKDGATVLLFRTDLYDRDIGEGAAQRVIDCLRGSQKMQETGR